MTETTVARAVTEEIRVRRVLAVVVAAMIMVNLPACGRQVTGLGKSTGLVPEGETLYLATDETDPEFLRPFRERFRLVQFHDLESGVVADTPPEWIGIVETLICAAAPQRFVGTRLSTFSARIATLRGHLSCGSARHAGIDTALYYTQPPLWQAGPEEQRPYAVPRRKHRDEHGETSTPWWQSIAREPVWGRAYEATWADAGLQSMPEPHDA